MTTAICATEILHGETSDEIHLLLQQIEEGLRADDATNFEKLIIARKYGPLLWQLKSLVPHGGFKNCLMERFPRNSYSKCNRWMVIAKHDEKVEEALTTYPEVAWGPKKMFDFLKGVWSPEHDHDEDDCSGSPSDIATVNEDSELPLFESTDGQENELGDSARWEEIAAKAESEAASIGCDSVVPSKKAILIATVFSSVEHDVIHDCLSRWQPHVISIYGVKGASSITVTVAPPEIPEVLLKLAASLKSSLPSQLKLSVEV